MKNADIRQLELMCELIETQSLSEAARRLGMTPSAASQSLSRLRTAFGEDVYARHGNTYRLTPHGHQVYGGLRSIVQRWHESLQVAQRFDPSDCELRFCVSCVGHSAVPDLIWLHAELRRQAPRARLDLQLPMHDEVDIQSLRSGKLDVLCASAAPRPEVRDVHHELLCQHELTRVLCSRSHPRIRDTLTLAQYLAEEHLIAHYRNVDPASRSPLDAALVANGSPMRRSTYVQSLWTCLHLVSQGDYLMTVSDAGARLLERHLGELRSLPVPEGLPTARSDLHMVWHERTHRSRPHQWLRQRLREACAPVPPSLTESA